jgi:hypothetical protein
MPAISTSTAWLSATAGTQSDAGQNWSDLTRTGVVTVAISDNLRAYCEVREPSDNPPSAWLNCAFSTLSGALPANATIEGVEVRVEGFLSTSDLNSCVIALTSDEDGTVLSGTSSKALSLPVGSSSVEAVVTVGGSSDLWGGVSISRAAIDDSAFRVAIQADGDRRGTIYVDHVQIRVHYGYTPVDESGLALFWSAP